MRLTEIDTLRPSGFDYRTVMHTSTFFKFFGKFSENPKENFKKLIFSSFQSKNQKDEMLRIPISNYAVNDFNSDSKFCFESGPSAKRIPIKIKNEENFKYFYSKNQNLNYENHRSSSFREAKV